MRMWDSGIAKRMIYGGFLVFFMWVGFVSSAGAVERRLHIDFDKVTNDDSIRLCNKACPDNDQDGKPDAVCIIGQIVETGDCIADGESGGLPRLNDDNSWVMPIGISLGDGIGMFTISTKLKDVTGNDRKIEGTVVGVTDQYGTEGPSGSNSVSFDQSFTLINNQFIPFLGVCTSFDETGQCTLQAPMADVMPYINPWMDIDQKTMKAEYYAKHFDDDFGPFRDTNPNNPSGEATDQFGRPLGFSRDGQWAVSQTTHLFRGDIRDQVTVIQGDSGPVTIGSTGYFKGKKGYVLCRCSFDTFFNIKRNGGFGGCNHCQYLIVWDDPDATPLKGNSKV